MTGWIALVLIVAAGRKAGVAAEAAKAREAELKFQKEASDAKDRMLDAAARRPHDRDELVGRMRDGSF